MTLSFSVLPSPPPTFTCSYFWPAGSVARQSLFIHFSYSRASEDRLLEIRNVLSHLIARRFHSQHRFCFISPIAQLASQYKHWLRKEAFAFPDHLFTFILHFRFFNSSRTYHEWATKIDRFLCSIGGCAGAQIQCDRCANWKINYLCIRRINTRRKDKRSREQKERARIAIESARVNRAQTE